MTDSVVMRPNMIRLAMDARECQSVALNMKYLGKTVFFPTSTKFEMFSKRVPQPPPDCTQAKDINPPPACKVSNS